MGAPGTDTGHSGLGGQPFPADNPSRNGESPCIPKLLVIELDYQVLGGDKWAWTQRK